MTAIGRNRLIVWLPRPMTEFTVPFFLWVSDQISHKAELHEEPLMSFLCT